MPEGQPLLINYPAGIAPSDIQKWAANSEKTQSLYISTHPLFSYHLIPPRLKSSTCFFLTLEWGKVQNARTIMWKEGTTHILQWMEPRENLAPSQTGNWIISKLSNRLGSGVCKIKVKHPPPPPKEFYTSITFCECGDFAPISILYKLNPLICTMEDLTELPLVLLMLPVMGKKN